MLIGIHIQDEAVRELVMNLARRQGWNIQCEESLPGGDIGSGATSNVGLDRAAVHSVQLVVTDSRCSIGKRTHRQQTVVLLPLRLQQEQSPSQRHTDRQDVQGEVKDTPDDAHVHVVSYTDADELVSRLTEIFDYVQLGLDYEANSSLFYRAAISYSHDGIICVDKAGVVHVFNRKASEVLGVPVESAIGRELVSFNPTAGLTRVLEQKEVEIEDVISINGRRVAANRAPIFVSGQLVGAISTFQDVTQLQRYEQTIRKRLSEGAFKAKVKLGDIVADSELTKSAVRYAYQCGQVDATVLITGESGTGKEMFAQGIHNASLRAKGPFVAVNCAALPETLLESELFGYDEGAFTGAQKGGKEGLFEIAHGGTLFLDEIGEVPVSFQTRLLRVLQEHEILRVGGRSTIPVDVRIVAATNQPLQRLVAEGKFRSDLFYRLFVLSLHVPPLRDRREDIPPLVSEFLKEFAVKYNKKNVHISAGAMQQLLHHDWPGNVRELRNIVERALIVTREHGEVTSTWVENALYTELDLTTRWPSAYHSSLSPHPPQESHSPHSPQPVHESRSPYSPYSPHSPHAPLWPSQARELRPEDKELVSIYERTHSVSACAEQLGVHRTTIWRRLKRLRAQGWLDGDISM
ncbi:sigma 54-interacting transcriptional regulator [Alicyclobacillus curvatus]|nr:sigma 54-interacting transcriptional regulator [Alicyclobacillus curvatus]